MKRQALPYCEAMWWVDYGDIRPLHRGIRLPQIRKLTAHRDGRIVWQRGSAERNIRDPFAHVPEPYWPMVADWLIGLHYEEFFL